MMCRDIPSVCSTTAPSFRVAWRARGAGSGKPQLISGQMATVGGMAPCSMRRGVRFTQPQLAVAGIGSSHSRASDSSALGSWRHCGQWRGSQEPLVPKARADGVRYWFVAWQGLHRKTAHRVVWA